MPAVEPSSPESQRARLNRAESVAVLGIGVLIAVLAVWSIWSVTLAISNDGPQAVFAAHVDAHYGDPGSIFAEQFTLGLGLGGRGFVLLYAPLAAVLPFTAAVRVAQTMIVLLLAAAGAALSWARHGRVSYAALLGFVAAFAWPVYMGFYAYCLGTSLGLFILAYVVRTHELKRIHKAIVFLSLLVQLILHPVAELVTLGLLVMMILCRAATGGPRGLSREAPWLVVFALPSALVVGLISSDQQRLSAVRDSESTEWASVSEWTGTIARIAVPGSELAGWFVLALALAALIHGLVHSRHTGSTGDRALALGGLGVLAVGLFGPLHVSGWQFFAPRFLCVGLVIAFSLLPKVQGAWRRVTAVAASAMLAIALVAIAYREHHRLDRACSDAIAGLNHVVPRTSYQLPIVLDDTCGLPRKPSQAAVPYLQPAFHLHALFAVHHGGTDPYVFHGGPRVHLVSAKPNKLPVPPTKLWGYNEFEPALVDPNERERRLDLLALYGTAYENVLVFGAQEPDRRQLITRGYAFDFEQGSFINAHFLGCRVDVLIDKQHVGRGVLVSAGVRDVKAWSAAYATEPGDVRASMQTFCGEIWVEVRWREGAQRCANADADGRIRVSATDQAKARIVRCVSSL